VFPPDQPKATVNAAPQPCPTIAKTWALTEPIDPMMEAGTAWNSTPYFAREHLAILGTFKPPARGEVQRLSRLDTCACKFSFLPYRHVPLRAWSPKARNRNDHWNMDNDI
jgi:hypothetical protein